MNAENIDEIFHEIVERKIGFLGTGQMGSSLILSFSKYLSNIITDDLNTYNIFHLYDVNENTRNEFRNYGFKNICHDEKHVFSNAKIIFICVKPDIVKNLILNNKEYITKETLLISIAAGTSIEFLSNLAASKDNPDPKIIRIMTNHLCLINEGASVFSSTKSCNDVDETIVRSLLSNVGIINKIDEKQMNVYTALAGSGPAFVYYFIESIIEGALRNGVDINTAREYASQIVYSAGKYMKFSKDKNPNNVKYIVTTPGGTTINGLTELDKNKFKYAVIQAITAATEKGKEIEIEKMKYFNKHKF